MNEDPGRVVFKSKQTGTGEVAPVLSLSIQAEMFNEGIHFVVFPVTSIILFPRLEHLDTYLLSIHVSHLSPELLAAFLEMHLVFVSAS